MQNMVSIIIPVYNGANYLRQAIDSALSQSYENCEVVVVNDGSNDNGATAEIARSYGDRIRYIEKDNGGVASAMNTGISQMHGDFFAWLSHDDWFLPEKISNQIELLKKNPQAVIVTGFSYYREATGELYATMVDFDFSSLNSVLKNLYQSKLSLSTMLIPKKIWKDLGGFDEHAKTTQDYDFLFRMLREGIQLLLLPEALMVHRHHAEQGTITLNEIHVQELQKLYSQATAMFMNELAVADLKYINCLISIMEQRTLNEAARRLNGIRSYILYKSGYRHSDPIIWLYWENKPESFAPTLIMSCWESINKHCAKDFNIILLDEVTVGLFLHHLHPGWRDFLEIAHRADYVRFMLLAQYGGIWLDSDMFVFRSLKPIMEKTREYGFVCTGYVDSDDQFFPTICFLSALPNNDIVLKLVENYHQYMNTTLTVGIQPAWDELGGHALAKLLPFYSHYSYPTDAFLPIPIQRHYAHLIQPVLGNVRMNLSKVYAQALPYSILAKMEELDMEEQARKGSCIDLVYKLALYGDGQGRILCSTPPVRYKITLRAFYWLYDKVMIKRFARAIKKMPVIGQILQRTATKYFLYK